jgi:hypothetical protein
MMMINKIKSFFDWCGDLIKDSELGPLARIMLVIVVPTIVILPTFFVNLYIVMENGGVVSFLVNNIFTMIVLWLSIILLFFATSCIVVGFIWVAGWIIAGKAGGDLEDAALTFATIIVGPLAFIFCFLFCKSDMKKELFKKPSEKAKDILLE